MNNLANTFCFICMHKFLIEKNNESPDVVADIWSHSPFTDFSSQMYTIHPSIHFISYKNLYYKAGLYS